MVQTRSEAVELMQCVFHAWNARDIDTMLHYFCDDLVFVEHAGKGGTKFKVRHGSRTFGDYLQTYLDVADCVSKIHHLDYDGIYIRSVINFDVVHRQSGLAFDGSFRQVIRLRGDLISHLDEYHDVDASASFWNLASS